MNRIYRGVVYSYDASQSTQKPCQQVRQPGPPYTLTYRGSSYTVDPSRQEAPIPGPAATYELIYRGSTYVVHQTAAGKRFIQNVQPKTPLSSYPQSQLD